MKATERYGSRAPSTGQQQPIKRQNAHAPGLMAQGLLGSEQLPTHFGIRHHEMKEAVAVEPVGLSKSTSGGSFRFIFRRFEC